MPYNHRYIFVPEQEDDLDPMQHTEEELDSDSIADWEEGFMNGQNLAA